MNSIHSQKEQKMKLSTLATSAALVALLQVVSVWSAPVQPEKSVDPMKDMQGILSRNTETIKSFILDSSRHEAISSVCSGDEAKFTRRTERYRIMCEDDGMDSEAIAKWKKEPICTELDKAVQQVKSQAESCQNYAAQYKDMGISTMADALKHHTSTAILAAVQSNDRAALMKTITAEGARWCRIIEQTLKAMYPDDAELHAELANRVYRYSSYQDDNGFPDEELYAASFGNLC